LFTVARNAAFKAEQHAYADRRRKRRALRRLWIVRINAAVRPLGLSYSEFIAGLSQAGVKLDRRVLAEMATTSPQSFAPLVELSKKALNAL